MQIADYEKSEIVESLISMVLNPEEFNFKITSEKTPKRRITAYAFISRHRTENNESIDGITETKHRVSFIHPIPSYPIEKCAILRS